MFYEQCFIKKSENYTKLKNPLNLFVHSEDVIRGRSRITETNQLTKMLMKNVRCY